MDLWGSRTLDKSNTSFCFILSKFGTGTISNEIIPRDNADMSNEKGKSPRLKLMVFLSRIKVTAPKFIELSQGIK